jgi:hypothetical protein
MQFVQLLLQNQKNVNNLSKVLLLIQVLVLQLIDELQKQVLNVEIKKFAFIKNI